LVVAGMEDTVATSVTVAPALAGFGEAVSVVWVAIKGVAATVDTGVDGTEQPARAKGIERKRLARSSR
jgi:hypothetical protein